MFNNNLYVRFLKQGMYVFHLIFYIFHLTENKECGFTLKRMRDMIRTYSLHLLFEILL